MFIVGSIGSFIVLILSGVEDLETIFGGEEEANHS